MANTSKSVETNVSFVTSNWMENITSIVSNVSHQVNDDVTTTSTQTDMTSYAVITEMMASQTGSHEIVTTPFSHYDLDYEYTEFMYTGFSFERPVYLYIWEMLVILTSLVNILVVSILLRRKMRNSTNVVLASIAISDSLTGLSTLPTYIMVYQSHEPPQTDTFMYQSDDQYNYQQPHYMYDNYPVGGFNQNGTYNQYDHGGEVPEYEGYYLSKNLCRWFMVTKFFISKSFHSISIYLTLFLGIQRFISVAAPFKAQTFTTEKAILCCIIIAILSPVLHVFHLFDEKAEGGMCEWDLADDGCKGGCIELWIMFFLRNLIPCGVLLVFTFLFIRELHKGEVHIRRMDSTRSQIARRVVENRRIAVIVTAIVIVFLIPEIPYGFYLLYNAIDKTATNGKNMNLETNRAIHMAYEILLVLSFHANFYIYTLFNRKFRIFLVKIFVQPVRRWMGDTRRVSISSSGSQRSTQRRTDLMSMKSLTSSNSLKKTISNTISKDTVESTAFMNSVSVDITQTTLHDKGELEALNANV